jgi:hypothetical protein
MRLTLSSVVSAGITASVVVVLFLMIVPKLIGLGEMDITRDIGLAFSTHSPHLAGAIFLALAGILWAVIFSVIYNVIPGSYFLKGSVFGILVGLFSLMIMPKLLTSMGSMIGTNQYSAMPVSVNIHAVITLIAYVIFGLTMAWSYRPSHGHKA